MKVRVLNYKGKFVVEVCYREPFEDMFEIATHVARFAHPRAANALAARVREAVKAAYPKSPATVLDKNLWIYSSSAYRNLSEMHDEAPAAYDVPASAAALAADAMAD